MTVTAVLARPGDWQTLLGWVNHETGDIACRSAASNIGGIGAMLLGGLLAYHLVGTNPIVAAFVIVISTCFCVAAVVGMRNAVGARRVLEATRAALAPRVADSNG